MTYPWHPISNPVDLKHLGKLAEELGELSAAVARCMIQGPNATEPTTGKFNLVWLMEEIADVTANVELVKERFFIPEYQVRERAERKKAQLREWHMMA